MKAIHNLSYWEHYMYLDEIDYLIIGCGMVGMLTALELRHAKPDSHIVIVERNLIGAGASTRNAGFACIGSLGEIAQESTIQGDEETLEIITRRYQGLKKLLDICDGLDIGYQSTGGFEVVRSEEDFNKIAAQIEYWNKKLEHVTNRTETFTIRDTGGIEHCFARGIQNHAEGLLDTAKLYKCLESKLYDNHITVLRGVNISDYQEGSMGIVLRSPEIAQSIKTHNLILCTNAFSKSLVPNVDIEPCRNQVIVTSPVNTEHLTMGYHMTQGYIYYRAIGDRVLIGGARHIFAEENNNSTFGQNESNKDYLIEILQKSIIPRQAFSIDYHWSGILSGGSKRNPIIKQISPHIYMGVRLGGMGVAIGSVIGSELTQLVLS